MPYETTPHFEPDTFVEGEETLDSGELTAMLEASLAELRAYGTGKAALRTTFLRPDGTRSLPEMLTRDQYRERRAEWEAEKPALTYDADIDTLGIHLRNAPATKTEEAADGVLFDYDSDGNVIGVEIPDATHRLPFLRANAQENATPSLS